MPSASGSESLGVGALDALPVTVAVLDPRGTILLVNRAWREFGRENGLTTPEAGIGVNYLDVSRAAAAEGDPHAQLAKAALEDIFDGRIRTATFEYPCHSPEVPRWFIFRASRFEVGSKPHVVVLHTDITARRTYEDTLQASRDALEGFNLAVSHDMRAPLRRIEELCNLATDAPEGTLRDLVARIRTEARRARALAADLLDLAYSGSAEISRAPLDISALASSIAEEMQVADPMRRSRVRVQQGMVDHADPARVRLILTNLLSNALKYTRGVSDPRVEVGTVASRGEATAYFVRDNGIGFEARDANQLFQPFRRLEGALPFEGTGIGLAIVRRAVEQHGGRVWAAGVPGEGATFYFTLHAA